MSSKEFCLAADKRRPIALRHHSNLLFRCRAGIFTANRLLLAYCSHAITERPLRQNDELTGVKLRIAALTAHTIYRGCTEAEAMAAAAAVGRLLD